MKAPPVFESRPCGRCGGCGEYSYCQMYGTRCFRCGGDGWVLTPRGKAAQAYLDELRSAPACEFQVGDLVRCEDFFRRLRWFGRIVSVTRDDAGNVVLKSEHPKCGTFVEHAEPSRRLRRGWTAEEKREQVEKALAYQSTLTKKGQPAKRKVVVS